MKRPVKTRSTPTHVLAIALALGGFLAPLAAAGSARIVEGQLPALGATMARLIDEDLVTVTGVDISTQVSATGSTISTRRLQDIPIRRSVESLLSLEPGPLEALGRTDAQGRSSLTLGPGRHVLVFEAPGFEKKVLEVSVEPGTTLILDLELEWERPAAYRPAASFGFAAGGPLDVGGRLDRFDLGAVREGLSTADDVAYTSPSFVGNVIDAGDQAPRIFSFFNRKTGQLEGRYAHLADEAFLDEGNTYRTVGIDLNLFPVGLGARFEDDGGLGAAAATTLSGAAGDSTEVIAGTAIGYAYDRNVFDQFDLSNAQYLQSFALPGQGAGPSVGGAPFQFTEGPNGSTWAFGVVADGFVTGTGPAPPGTSCEAEWLTDGWRLAFLEFAEALLRLPPRSLEALELQRPFGPGCRSFHSMSAERAGDHFVASYAFGGESYLSAAHLEDSAYPVQTWKTGTFEADSVGAFGTGLRADFISGAMDFELQYGFGSRLSGALAGETSSGGAEPGSRTWEWSEDALEIGFDPWEIPGAPISVDGSGPVTPVERILDLSGRIWRVAPVATADLEALEAAQSPSADGDSGGPAAIPSAGSSTELAAVLEPGCVDLDDHLCLLGNRFSVTAHYTTPQGDVGRGHARSLSDGSGTFWFFTEGNREIIAKVIDACAFGGHYWFFAAGVTNVGVRLEVWDRYTGLAKHYQSDVGETFQPILDTAAIPCAEAAARGEALHAVRTPPSALPTLVSAPERGDGTACGGEADDLCLRDGRFRVEADWTNGSGVSGAAFGGRLSEDTGVLFFDDPSRVELLVKVLDSCIPAFERFWVFAGGTTNQQVTLRVTDTATGAESVYRNPQGRAFVPINDTDAFATCDV